METIIFSRYNFDDLRRIEQIVEERESFVAILDGDLYRLVHHIGQRSEFEFTATLDRNVYTRITALVRGDPLRPNELQDLRWAAAILAFCQIADITFDYASSLYEYARTRGGTEALKEMERFRIADNSDPQIFIDFALGRIGNLPESKLAKVAITKPVPPAEEFEKRTRDFRVNYTFALKIAALSRQNIPAVEKMTRFIDWMYADFMFGSPALLFASRYFSPNPHKRMLKGFSKENIENAAWDMAFVQGWRRGAVKGVENNQPLLLISGDRAVRDMARRMVADSENDAIAAMKDVWGRNTPDGRRVYEHYSRMWQKADARKPPVHEAQLKLLEELEREVYGQQE